MPMQWHSRTQVTAEETAAGAQGIIIKTCDPGTTGQYLTIQQVNAFASRCTVVAPTCYVHSRSDMFAMRSHAIEPHMCKLSHSMMHAIPHRVCTVSNKPHHEHTV
jgi:hypothetical protein